MGAYENFERAMNERTRRNEIERLYESRPDLYDKTEYKLKNGRTIVLNDEEIKELRKKL